MQESFRLGIFTSSGERTVAQVLPMLEKAAGAGVPLFPPRLVFFRSHTAPAPVEHVAAGGDAWDTVKPLGRYFPNLRRVILVDDDHWKVHLPHSRPFHRFTSLHALVISHCTLSTLCCEMGEGIESMNFVSLGVYHCPLVRV